MHYLLLITSLITVGFTTLVSVPSFWLLIGGMTQADISDMYPTVITPIGFTFSIWSVIYLSWIVVWVMLARKKIHEKSLPVELMSLAIGLTGFWLIPWGYGYIGISLVIMLLLLSVLIYTFSLVRWENHGYFRSMVEITLGWIMVATVVNITVYMQYLGLPYGQPGDLYYAIVVLWVLLLIVSELQCRYKTYIISAVFLWTMSGEWFAHTLFEQRVAVTIYAVTLCIYIWSSFHGKSTSLKAMKFW